MPLGWHWKLSWNRKRVNATLTCDRQNIYSHQCSRFYMHNLGFGVHRVAELGVVELAHDHPKPILELRANADLGSISATSSRQGTTLSISSRNTRLRVCLEHSSKPDARLSCFIRIRLSTGHRQGENCPMGRGFARFLSWVEISRGSAPVGELYCPMDCRLVDPVLIRHPDNADALEDDLLGGLIGTPIVERVDAA
jgi:hypothetical protein